MGKSKKTKEDSSNDKDDLGLDTEKTKLQAVVLGDSFQTSFQPLSLDQPKVLCPLNNVTILDYVFDFLAGNGVEEVFVIGTSDALEDALNDEDQSAWKGRLSIECIKDTSLTNAGDSLRELYKRNLIQSDPFLLLFGDVVTNIDLTQALKDHEARHKKDSAAIMTLVLNPTGDTSALQPASEDLVVGMDPSQENRILLFDPEASKSQVALPCSFFASHTQMEVRTDLLDTGIYICSPDVLGRFEDEFDYLEISNHFVTNCVAEEEEGLQSRIHAHVLGPGDYAARIQDPRTYHAISNDLLRRWAYPIVADNLHSTPQLYKPSSSTKSSVVKKGKRPLTASSSPETLTASLSTMASQYYYQYKEILHPSKVERSCTIQGPGMLGSHGNVQEGATVLASVIGHSVQIGPRAQISKCHLWDHVSIGENAQVTESILAKNCVIGKNAVINKGCVIGEGCKIGDNVTLPEYTRITLQEDDEDPFGDDDDYGDWTTDEPATSTSLKTSSANDTPNLVTESTVTTDVKVVGQDGKGRVWHPSLEDEDDEDSDDDDDDGDENDGAAGYSKIQLQSIGTELAPYYEQRFARQAKTAAESSDGFSVGGGPDDEEARMESEAFAAYTEGAFTFEDTPATGTASSIPSSSTTVVGRQKGVDVVKELKEICLEFDDNGNTPMENLAIELNSYKFSQNATYSDCTMAATLAMLENMKISPDMSDGKLITTLKQKLQFWAPLLQKMSIGRPEELAIIKGLEQAAISKKNEGMAKKLSSSGPSFRFVLQTLHDEEVLSEETLLAWAEERKGEPADSDLGKLFAMESVQDFLEWLQEDEESDSDDDDSEDSD